MEQGKYEKHLHDKLKEDVQQLRRELILRQDANKTELLNYYKKETYIKTMAFTLIVILVLVLLIIICFSQPSKMNGMYNHVFMLISHSSLATIVTAVTKSHGLISKHYYELQNAIVVNIMFF